MSRLEVPIQGKVLWATGDVILWANLNLLLKDSAGNLHPDTFLVDTGTQVTTFPAVDAKKYGLPIPLRPLPLTHQQTGLEVRSGFLRFRVAGMDATEYVGSCLFLGDPDTSPPQLQQAASPRMLLQPLSLVGQLRFDFDKDAKSIGTPFGVMTVEKKVP
jgi:hypothetical protein